MLEELEVVHKSETDRRRLITAYEPENQDFLRLALQLGINKETARSIVKVYITEDRSEKLRRGGNRHQKK